MRIGVGYWNCDESAKLRCETENSVKRRPVDDVFEFPICPKAESKDQRLNEVSFVPTFKALDE